MTERSIYTSNLSTLLNNSQYFTLTFQMNYNNSIHCLLFIYSQQIKIKM